VLSDDLIELQRLDTTADQLAHRRTRLPERDPAAAASAAVQQADRRRAEIRQRLDELDRAIEALEQEGRTLTAQRDRLQTQLKTVISPREAEALMSELDALHGRHGALDDRELEHLEEQSALADELAALDAEEPSRRSIADAAREALAAAEAVIDAELDATRAARSVIADRLDAGVLGQYQRLRERMGGVAVSTLDGKRCTGCHLDLSASELDQVRATPPGELTDCPECGRILVP
jgi:predicted  nucleic acid-binding Zn-ribbon protein